MWKDTDKVYITNVHDYNEYAEKRYKKEIDAWKFGESFPYPNLLFIYGYGYVCYRVDESGAILSATWAKTKKALQSL